MGGKCDTTGECLECANNKCSACLKGLFVDHNGKCVKECARGYFADKNAGVCKQCDVKSGCLKCSEFASCEECKVSSFIDYTDKCKSCEDGCQVCSVPKDAKDKTKAVCTMC